MALQQELDHDFYADSLIRDVLTSVRSIAVLGASPNPSRPSNGVTGFLISRGYKVFAVNPGHAGKIIAGAATFAELNDLPEPVDMVDVFRAPQHLPSIIQSVLHMPVLPKVIWTQLNVRDDHAARQAESAGLTVIQDRCPAIEIPRLGL